LKQNELCPGHRDIGLGVVLGDLGAEVAEHLRRMQGVVPGRNNQGVGVGNLLHGGEQTFGQIALAHKRHDHARVQPGGDLRHLAQHLRVLHRNEDAGDRRGVDHCLQHPLNHGGAIQAHQALMALVLNLGDGVPRATAAGGQDEGGEVCSVLCHRKNISRIN
jgi:hypothetical protein